MKKLIVLTGILLSFSSVFAGGLLTNGNQSAQYIRMLSRNGSTSVDAVYFNPAGLIKLEDGLYISIQNQSIVQSKSIVSGYPLLNNHTYDGATSAPIFPTAYAVYKKDKFAFSIGFGPNSGGGSAEFDKGLPSFEKTISNLVPGLAGLTKIGKSVSNYSTDISFNGKSVYWGIQGGITYKLNDKLSVYGGARYIPATNKYDGYIRNIQLKVNGVNKNATSFLQTEAAPILTAAANNATGAATSVAPIISGGGGAYTLAQVQGAGMITPAQRTQLESGLLGLGQTQTAINAMTITQVQAAFNGGAAALNSQAASLVATGNQLNDKSVDVKQTGSGITPIIGLNYSPCQYVNFGFKYEFKTKLTLTNATAVDGTGMFPDKAQTKTDIPSLFSMGADFKVNPKWKLSVSYNSYRDKGVDWGNNIYGEARTVSHNVTEFSFGAQYQVCKMVAMSAGYLRTRMLVPEQFNSDFSYYQPANTIGGGFEIKPTPKLTVDLGALVTGYDNVGKTFSDATVGYYVETYKKHNVAYAVGLAYRFGL